MIRCLWLRFRFCPGFWFRAYAASGNSSIPGRPWGFWISNRGKQMWSKFSPCLFIKFRRSGGCLWCNLRCKVWTSSLALGVIWCHLLHPNVSAAFCESLWPVGTAMCTSQRAPWVGVWPAAAPGRSSVTDHCLLSSTGPDAMSLIFARFFYSRIYWYWHARFSVHQLFAYCSSFVILDVTN